MCASLELYARPIIGAEPVAVGLTRAKVTYLQSTAAGSARYGVPTVRVALACAGTRGRNMVRAGTTIARDLTSWQREHRVKIE